MPNTREKLFEILGDNAQCNGVLGIESCDTCPHKYEENCYTAAIVEHLIANGVTVIPCKVGDTVYTNIAMRGWYYRDKYRPYSATVVFIGLNNSEEMGGGLINVLYGKNGNMMRFRFSDVGKTVFLSRDEAEKALAER